MTGGFGFDHPLALCALLAFIPLALFDIFSGAGGRKRKLPAGLQKRLLASRALFRISAACLILALAGPRWGMARSSGVYRRSLDVVFAIDVSRSMEAADAPPFESALSEQKRISRLERGLAIAREAVLAVPGARYAAAVSRNRGLVTVPLTWDNEAALVFLESLDGSSLSGRGTNLESLVDAAASAFQNSFPARRLVALVSDGEALSGSLKAALDRCAAEDITVSAIALGSDEGAPVPAAEGGAAEKVISRRDAAVMRMAAERTGGLFIDGNSAEAAGELAAHLCLLGAEAEGGSGRRDPKSRRYLFIIAAIIAYGASKFIPLGKRGRP
jgi:Ca-activated chloride channel family protein